MSEHKVQALITFQKALTKALNCACTERKYDSSGKKVAGPISYCLGSLGPLR